MKLKYYMRGLGIGIILTTLILTIGDRKERLSDQEIIQQATKLGMVMEEDTENKLNTIINDKKTTGEVSVTPKPAADKAVTITPTVKPTISPSPKKKAVNKSKKKPDNNQTKATQPQKKPDNNQTKATQPQKKPDNNQAKATQPQKKTEQVQKKTAQVQKKVTFTITKGMSSGKVAKLLQKKGLVKDAKDFNAYIVKHGKEAVINIGTFEITGQPDYETLLNIIAEQ